MFSVMTNIHQCLLHEMSDVFGSLSTLTTQLIIQLYVPRGSTHYTPRGRCHGADYSVHGDFSTTMVNKDTSIWFR